MCGIITIIRKDGRTVSKQLFKSYTNQKSRGSEGFGFIAFDGNTIARIKRSADEKGITEALQKTPTEGIIFHHRTPTSTPNYKELAHPIEVKNKALKYNYYVIHNGIIQNDEELRAKHEGQGYNYTTLLKQIDRTNKTDYTSEKFNDSESLAIELAQAIDEGKDGIPNVKGSIAFVMAQLDKKGKLRAIYFGRNTGNPLKMENSKDFWKLSSEGNGENIDDDILFMLNPKTLELTQTDFTVGQASSYVVHGYDDDEDYDIPKTPEQMTDDDKATQSVLMREYEKIGQQIAQAQIADEPDENEIQRLEDDQFEIEEELWNAGLWPKNL